MAERPPGGHLLTTTTYAAVVAGLAAIVKVTGRDVPDEVTARERS